MVKTMTINIDLEKKIYEDLQKRLNLENQRSTYDTYDLSPMFEKAWYFGQQENDYQFTLGDSSIILNQ